MILLRFLKRNMTIELLSLCPCGGPHFGSIQGIVGLIQYVRFGPRERTIPLVESLEF